MVVNFGYRVKHGWPGNSATSAAFPPSGAQPVSAQPQWFRPQPVCCRPKPEAALAAAPELAAAEAPVRMPEVRPADPPEDRRGGEGRNGEANLHGLIIIPLRRRQSLAEEFDGLFEGE